MSWFVKKVDKTNSINFENVVSRIKILNTERSQPGIFSSLTQINVSIFSINLGR